MKCYNKNCPCKCWDENYDDRCRGWNTSEMHNCPHYKPVENNKMVEYLYEMVEYLCELNKRIQELKKADGRE